MPAPTLAPTDPVILITGVTGALGRAVVQGHAASSAHLALVGRDAGRLAAVAADAGLPDGRWVAAVGDLTRRDDARRVVETVVARFGRIDVLLHLIGGYAGGVPVLDVDPARVAEMLDQHGWSTLHVVQAVVPGMVERGWGRVIAVSAPVAVNAPPRMLPYALGKAAEETILRTLARELAGSGVTANVLVIRKLDAAHERETDPSPKNVAWSTPEEVAAAIAFLCSDAAAPVTGARIPLDGRG